MCLGRTPDPLPLPTLNVSGDSGANQLIIYQEITVNGDKIGVYDDVADVRHENDAWLASNITLISIDANAGNDFVEIESNRLGPVWGDEAVSEPIDMYGGDGNDTLNGGDGNDTVRGGHGDDELHGYGGADTMYGSDGADVFYSNDFDSDTMYGGAGNDTFLANDDFADYIDGGADTDTATSRDMLDTTVNVEFS